MNLDMINGSFELVAGLFSILNINKLYKDKIVHDVSLIPNFVFTMWGGSSIYSTIVN